MQADGTSATDGKLRHVPVSWSALWQAAACQYLSICGTEIREQGRVENQYNDCSYSSPLGFKLFTLAESLMSGLLPLFKAGERLEAPFSLPHSSHETRSIKIGPNLEPKTLNVHQLDAGKSIQLATPTPGGPPGGRVARSVCFPRGGQSGRKTHMAFGMALLPE